jgi:hypothetical protein
MYVLSIFSAAEMEKAATKRTSKNASLRLETDEPWDTMKAQILVQVEQALSPQHLDFSKYEVMFYIPRVLPKPGLVLATDTDYNYMVERARNIKTADPVVNLVIVEKKDPENKENLPGEKGAEAKPKKKVSTHIYINLTVYQDYQRSRHSPRQRQQEQQYLFTSRALEVPETTGDLCRSLLLP